MRRRLRGGGDESKLIFEHWRPEAWARFLRTVPGFLSFGKNSIRGTCASLRKWLDKKTVLENRDLAQFESRDLELSPTEEAHTATD